MAIGAERGAVVRGFPSLPVRCAVYSGLLLLSCEVEYVKKSFRRRK